EWPLFVKGVVVVLAIKPLVLALSGMYRNLWRYASLQDTVEIFRVVTIASFIATLVLMTVDHPHVFPRSIYFLDWFLFLFFLAASRLAWRLVRERQFTRKRSNGGCKTLIVGAGEAGSMLLKEIMKQPDSPYEVVGFVDDDRAKAGMRLHGVPVLGDTLRLSQLVSAYRIEKVIIALPSASGRVVRAIIRRCRMAGVRFKTLPGVSDIINGKVSVSQIKDVEIDDLLGREPVLLDDAAIRGYLSGKSILVTGAGGSIGSEICRQLARFAPRKIILFDSAETPLFYIEQELAKQHPGLTVIPVLGDIRQADRVEEAFETCMPEVVFHAAAYKHVPMMEYNPAEAVTNNIGGTRVLAETAHRFGVKDFVMISTDKAVNPTNVMGASKRVAELHVQALAGRSATRFSTVRFGNVLGSNGSVIPMFKEQIRNGGPVTVTDPKVVRYFMTIPEATQLVLQAGCIGRGGEIFLLDMGEPVPILELAEELIKLSGLIPYEDIDITFTGLRPGEKLFEELLIEGEGIGPTVHDKIKVLAPVTTDYQGIVAAQERLLAAARAFDLGGIMTLLQELVPEYSPALHFNGDPPPAFLRLRPDLFPAVKRTALPVTDTPDRPVYSPPPLPGGLPC
ncbi:MAG: polysaccharide biosynthesis protein, partial [Geobacteraceae bacterium]|nr:polysaccharide biosynthesis protein [Geobacteraceae bacterium]